MFVVISNYFNTGVFGIYSSLRRARLAIEYYFRVNKEADIASFEDINNYTYQILTKNGEIFHVEIVIDILDCEFTHGEIEED